MAVKRYNGTSWDTVAGLGAQGAAATSSSITTWVKTASGGETSLTGNSDSSTTLAYTPGQEQLFINGVLQVRGSDYTATNGTSITGLAALTAGDIATVTTVNAFSVTGAVPLSTVTANGDLIVGTSSGAVGRLGIGSSSQVLTVSGGVPTWATPTPGALTKITSATFTTVADTGTTFDGVFSSSYKNYYIMFSNIVGSAANTDFNFQLRKSGPTTQASAYYGVRLTGATATTISNGTAFKLFTLQTEASSGDMTLARNATPTSWSYKGLERYLNTTILAAGHNDSVGANSALGFILSASSGTISGFVAVYGLAD
jgi:hypothetical protein